jgi:ElaB/YqjD/DUF883 family membrane-anchored ribosome-binding protein
MERPDELNSNPDVQQLKAEISDTQAELHQTVAEIQDRLSPTHIKNQAADTVRDAASNVRDATIGRVQHMVRGQNPIPYALIGIGAAWLLASNRRRRTEGDVYAEYDSSWDTSTSYISSEDEFASPYAGHAFAEESQESGRLGRAGSNARQRASEMSREARERARRAATQARSRFDGMMHDNPMTLGIAALAAGAVVGAALPRTRMENQYMGETRDQLLDNARSMAHDSVESARSMAKGAIENVTGGEAQRSDTSSSGMSGGSSTGASTAGSMNTGTTSTTGKSTTNKPGSTL